MIPSSEEAPDSRERYLEGLHAEQAANGIERRGDVDVEVGVHSAGDSTVALYDGHRHPFLP